MGLADGSGAWWFRYLLMNPGRGGCDNPKVMPVQVWATWFPRDGEPQTTIEGFSIEGLDISGKGQSPFHLRVADNCIDDVSCEGCLDHGRISWRLQYRSTFHVTLSTKGWIGFSRTPHSDAIFSGRITANGQSFEGSALGFGVQGHNCGYRHRKFWTWSHAYFQRKQGAATTLEALVYEMPFGLKFRKVVLWHDGVEHVFRHFPDSSTDNQSLSWRFSSRSKDGLEIQVYIDGSATSPRRGPYAKTDCSGSFDVINNSLSRAVVRIMKHGRIVETLETNTGAVLETAGM
jgi:hypothetical protein